VVGRNSSACSMLLRDGRMLIVLFSRGEATIIAAIKRGCLILSTRFSKSALGL